MVPYMQQQVFFRVLNLLYKSSTQRLLPWEPRHLHQSQKMPKYFNTAWS